MNSIDDLRSTLGRHSDALDDRERYIRPVAVHARIRVVRRRRTAAVAVAAAVALAATAAGIGALRQPDGIRPASSVVGVDVPGSIKVLGFPYDLSNVHEFDGGVHVDTADQDRVVLLAASDLGSGSATLYSQGEAVARVRGDEQVAAPVSIGDIATDLRVRYDGAGADARAGVAVYEATGDPAPGVTNGNAVFRDEVAGSPLVAAAFSTPGERSVEVDATSTGGPLRFVFYCSAKDHHLWLNVSVDGDGSMGSTCGSSGPDAGTGSSGTSWTSAGDHQVRAYLTDGTDGPEVAPPDGVVIGVGVYQLPTSGPRVMGQRTERQVEYGGRDWVLDRVAGSATTVDTASGDMLIGLVGRGNAVQATWSGQTAHGETSMMDSGSRPASTLGGILLAGDRYDVTVQGGEGELLIYRPL